MVLYKVNGEKGKGPELKKQFAVVGYPTFVMVNPDLKLINSWSGYTGKDAFSQRLNTEMVDLTPIEEKKQRYKNKPTPKLALSLAGFYESRLETGHALQMVKDAIKMAPDKEVSLRMQVLRLQRKILLNNQEGATIDDMGKTLSAILDDPKTTNDQRSRLLIRGSWLFFDKGRPQQGMALLDKLHALDKASLSKNSKNNYDTGLTYKAWVKDLERFTESPAETSASVLKTYVGDYGNHRLELKNGNLRYSNDKDKVSATGLIPISKNTFYLEGKPLFRIEIVVDEQGRPTKLVGLYPGGYREETARN